MKLARLALVMSLGLAVFALAFPAATTTAQVDPGWLQVWKVNDPATGQIRIEYRDSTGQVLATYNVNQDFNSAEAVGPYVLGEPFQAIAFLDPYQGSIVYQDANIPPDTSTMFYTLSPGAAVPGGQDYAFAYTITAMPSEFEQPAVSTLYYHFLDGSRTQVYQQSLGQSMRRLEVVGFTDTGEIVLAVMPVGIGGYILFWTYSEVSVLNPATGIATPVPDMSGFSPDGQFFGRVTIDNGQPALEISARDGALMLYPGPVLPEPVQVGGSVTFSPTGRWVAYQVARQDPENEKFWTIVADTQTGQSSVVLEDQAQGYDLAYGHISRWMDDNTLVVGDAWSGSSAIIDVTTNQLLRTATGQFLGYVVGLPNTTGFAASSTAAEQCPGAPPSRLQAGERGRVTFTNGLPVRVRQTPNGTQIGTQPEGATFYVFSGPECAFNYAWWYLEFDDGTVGYVAEGDFDGYYLEPWQ
ncbi:MAG: hypothetical protein GYB65_04565 [Chloroflexi bacterium]|nr:hypothetical protein [Chloroflexota bacterium]